MQMIKATGKWATGVTLAGVVLLLAGCPKPSSEEQPPKPPKPIVKQPVKPVPNKGPSLPELPPEPTPVTQPVAPTPAKPNVIPISQLPGTPADLEKLYVTKPDFETKINIIYKLSTMNNFLAVEALNQLFLADPDIDMKMEILDSLENTHGLVDKKLGLLKAAVGPDQNSEVRLTAVEALISLGDLQALTVLQPLLSDKSREIRDVASAAIIEVQELANRPPPQPGR